MIALDRFTAIELLQSTSSSGTSSDTIAVDSPILISDLCHVFRLNSFGAHCIIHGGSMMELKTVEGSH